MAHLEKWIWITQDFLWSYIVVTLLIFASIYFTILLKGVQFTNFLNMFTVLWEKNQVENQTNKLSAFQAFCVSTAARVGTGNLAGVATAISIGGPGAIFWMWLMASFSGASSFVENVLGQLYKQKNSEGNYIGGPAYYIQKGLNKKKLAIFFAISLILCFGFGLNSVQSNTIASAFEKGFGIPNVYSGLILAISISYIVFGSDRRVVRFATWLVPIMSILYILITLYIVLMNLEQIPQIFILIWQGAFSFKSLSGGIIGDQMKNAIVLGVKRGLLSNEAGMGSSPNVGAIAEVTHPAKQGIVQIFGVFFDTIIICSCTAFMVLLSNLYLDPDLKGIQLTQAAIALHVGDWGIYFLALCVLLFAFSSILGNHFYAESNVKFISSKISSIWIYRLSMVLSLFLGAILSMDLVWDFTDLTMALMVMINIFAIILLAPISKKVYLDYLQQKKMKQDPCFKKAILSEKEAKNIEFWD